MQVSRLKLMSESDGRKTADMLMADMGRRLATTPPDVCPVDMVRSFVGVCHAQSCGKCTPCRVGLSQLLAILADILEGKADEESLELLEKTAMVIADTSDCAIGYDAARIVLTSLNNFKEDYLEHVNKKRCKGGFATAVPCTKNCPANVDVPGYLALISEKRYDDAVELIRKDNPFPVACAYVCEHPCERHCRRRMIDYSLNIRALKRYAVDHAGEARIHKKAEPTGKKVAVIGAGPGGLTAAYFLSLMGHSVTVFEKQKRAGGMLRYGIPAYRLPREKLDRDINNILETGVELKLGVDVGSKIEFNKIKDSYDAVFVSIGAHLSSSARIEGEELEGVMSAVELVRDMGDDMPPDLRGKRVIVIGGGNVAMDVARTCIRLGAVSVDVAYRRRRVDMTAQAEEIEGAIAEGASILELKAPLKIVADDSGRACALLVMPQIPGEVGKDGRPKPIDSALKPERLPADLIIIAVGQRADVGSLKDSGVLVTRRNLIEANEFGQNSSDPKIFAGGECVTGPATVIRAIEAGKVAASNIDKFLGFNHKIKTDIKVPEPKLENKPARGRINTAERPVLKRRSDFNCIEIGLTEEEALFESSRCLRCDVSGFGTFRGGREVGW